MTELRSWRLWAHQYNDCFSHVGPLSYMQLHLLADPIVEVDVREDPEGAYWGWLATDEDLPTMIWGSRAQFHCCFPYGPEVEQAKGKGHVLRLSVALAQGASSSIDCH